jgi:hypothetical protein
MRTEKQINASKTNGEKSRGPATREGKANSSQNAVRHNLCTGHLVVLSTEDPREFLRHENYYFDRFQPLDGVERDLVHKMIAASWREKRIASMESAVFELEMDRQRSDIEEEFDFVSPQAREALALFGTSDTVAAANLLLRYGSAVRRSYASAYRILKDLQGDRFNRNPAIITPEISGTNPSEAGDHTSDVSSAPPPQPSVTADPGANEAIATATSRIVVVRRRTEAQTSPVNDSENTKLRNEPKTTEAAIASANAVCMGRVALPQTAAASAQAPRLDDRDEPLPTQIKVMAA